MFKKIVGSSLGCLLALSFNAVGAAPLSNQSSPLGINTNEALENNSSLPFIDLFRLSMPFDEARPWFTKGNVRYDKNGWPSQLNGGKGNIWIGAEGWGSTPIERIRARSYGYDATMKLQVMAEDKALEEVAAAVKQDKNIVFFCYTPHHMFTLFDLVILKEPAYDANQWVIVQPSPTPGWLEKSTAGVAWEKASLNVSYASTLEASQPKAAAMLNKVSLTTDTVSAMTYALAVEKQEPAAFAKKWIETNADTVNAWFQ